MCLCVFVCVSVWDDLCVSVCVCVVWDDLCVCVCGVCACVVFVLICVRACLCEYACVQGRALSNCTRVLLIRRIWFHLHPSSTCR